MRAHSFEAERIVLLLLFLIPSSTSLLTVSDVWTNLSKLFKLHAAPSLSQMWTKPSRAVSLVSEWECIDAWTRM